jgi:hypothetical protein
MGVTPGDLAQQNQTHNRKMAINFPFVYFLFLFYFFFLFLGAGVVNLYGMFPHLPFFVFFLVCVCLVQI